ncbi:MAG: ATP-binding protein [Acidobacteriota bacterium]
MNWWSLVLIAMAVAAGVVLERFRRSRLESLDRAGPQWEALERCEAALRQKEEEIRRVETQLMLSGKMAALGQLVAGVAHEMTNSINFIASGVPSLARNFEQLSDMVAPGDRGDRFRALGGRLERLLAAIEDGADRTAEIVKHLGTFSHPDQGEVRSLELSSALDSTLVLIHYQIRGRIDVVRWYGPEVPEIRCLDGQLNQVFMNLLVNAVQAIEGEGTITVTTSLADSDRVRVSIRDTGRGMSPDVRERAFDTFFTTKAADQGTGLGLSISRRIVERHGGSIRVEETASGEGTEVTVLLPVQPPIEGPHV